MNGFLLALPTYCTALFRALRRALRLLVRSLGLLALLMVLLSFTSLPWRIHQALGTAAGTCAGIAPRVIVVLGGSGMPSGPELLRLQHAAALATQYPASAVVVVHPTDPAVMDAMLHELLHRGVAGERLIAVREGTNTREQALVLHTMWPAFHQVPMALVTAPENSYRSVRAFRKVGFQNVCGDPAWDNPMYIDLAYDHRRVGGKRYAPDVSGSNALRYDVWNRLKLQVTCLRESLAIGYYRLNGWI